MTAQSAAATPGTVQLNPEEQTKVDSLATLQEDTTHSNALYFESRDACLQAYRHSML